MEELVRQLQGALTALEGAMEEAEKNPEALLLPEVQHLLRNVAGAVQELQDLAKAVREARSRVQEPLPERRTVTGRGGCYVVKYVYCGKNCSGCPHGPYLYRVYRSGGKQHWEYLGRADK